MNLNVAACVIVVTECEWGNTNQWAVCTVQSSILMHNMDKLYAITCMPQINFL